MAYDPAVLRRASGRLEDARKSRQEALERRRKQLFARLPELADIDRQLRGTILDIIRSSLRSGVDPGPALRVVKDRNMVLQNRQAELLRSAGYPPDALADTPACKACGDTGWVGTRMCSCLRALCAEEQVKELSKLLDLGEQSFDSFSLDLVFPPPLDGGNDPAPGKHGVHL